VTRHHSTTRRGIRTAFAAIAATAALVLSGCAAGGTDSADDSEEMSSIVVAAAGIPTTWAHDSGAFATSKYDYLTLSQGFLVKNPYIPSDDGVTMLQDVSSFEGDLAESYEVSDDGLVYTFHLREDAVSAAGNPLTADDVLWTYERKFATPTSSVQFVNRPILTDPATQIQKVDDHTVTFTIEEAGYGFTLLSLLANSTGGIFDSVLLQEHATDDDPYAVTWSDTNWDSNYGFGPYMVESVSGDTEFVMVANPNWWGGTPAIERITFRAIADPATRASALATGEVQAAMALRASESVDLVDNPDVAVPSGSWSNGLLMAPLMTDKAPFDDELVRQAFAYAVPYEQIVDTVYVGRATVDHGILDKTLPGYTDEGLPEYSYDPEEALALLEEAGLDEVAFTLTYASGTPDVADAAIQIQSAAADAGFDITLEELPIAAFSSGRAESEYQAVLQRDGAIVQAPSYEISLFTGEGATTNYARWENPEFYAAVDAAIEAGEPTTDEAGQAWAEAESILLTEAPYVFIARPMANWAVAAELAGAQYRTDSTIDWSAVTPGE